jgi:hypothetical protein
MEAYNRAVCCGPANLWYLEDLQNTFGWLMSCSDAVLKKVCCTKELPDEFTGKYAFQDSPKTIKVGGHALPVPSKNSVRIV